MDSSYNGNMKIYFNPEALLGLPEYGIQIPMTDGRILKIVDYLNQRNHPIVSDYLNNLSLTRQDLASTHSEAFLDQLFGPKEEIIQAVARTFELINPDGSYNRYTPETAQYSLEELVNKVLLQIKGTMASSKEALVSGESYYLGGGYHHAMSFGGRGFCMLNDIVITARWLQKQGLVKKVWVIDVDAHKGDGTAELTQGDESIRTLSIHMEKGWPLDSGGPEDPWYIPNDIEIGIPAGGESLYLKKLEDGLQRLEQLDQERPDLAIVVQGSDPYEKDQLPSSALLKLSAEEMLERDLMVYNFLKKRNIPQSYVMAGGYGEYAYEVYCQFFSRIL